MNTQLKRAALGILAAAVMAGPVLLAGCASDRTGIKSETQETLNQKLTRSKTTKAEVIHQLGEPAMKGMTGTGQEYWSYFDERAAAPLAQFGGYGDGVKILTVFFTPKDVVDNFRFSVSRD